ncbi:hypothetical protein Holit_02986 [Hollandina sp. SP2]
MKKLIALSVVLVVLAGAGFAEVTVSGQVDAVVMPLQVIAPDGEDTLIGAGVGRNGSGDAPRVRIGVVGGTEQVGINFKIQFNPKSSNSATDPRIGIDDFAEVWWKPVSQLKIEAGKFVNDTLRGKIGDDNWQRYTVGMKNPDGMFTRFSSGNAGFMLGLTPIEPLYIGVSVPSVVQFTAGFPDTVGSYYSYEGDTTPTAADADDFTKVGNVIHTYEKIQAAVGYTIPNIGLFRVQYVGASHIDPEGLWTNPLNVRRIEAAFAFTGMKGLVIDVGGKVPLAFDTYENAKAYEWDNDGDGKDNIPITHKVTGGTKYQAPFQVSLGAGYTADALDIKGRVDAQFGASKKMDNYEKNPGLDVNVHLWPSYNLGFATAGLDVGFNFIGDTEEKIGDTTTTTEGGYQFGIGAWLKKAYGSASIKGGLALSLGEKGGNKLPTVFSVPIIFDYSF